MLACDDHHSSRRNCIIADKQSESLQILALRYDQQVVHISHRILLHRLICIAEPITIHHKLVHIPSRLQSHRYRESLQRVVPSQRPTDPPVVKAAGQSDRAWTRAASGRYIFETYGQQLQL
eukprot:GHVS01063841.1.p2 GENE.GHVS01063841.1~~GHVS01063841.1.p2  ORF type:complete len:121 (+),score=13.13 GHVS01063841.1:111-473(+)